MWKICKEVERTWNDWNSYDRPTWKLSHRSRSNTGAPLTQLPKGEARCLCPSRTFLNHSPRYFNLVDISQPFISTATTFWQATPPQSSNSPAASNLGRAFHGFTVLEWHVRGGLQGLVRRVESRLERRQKGYFQGVVRTQLLESGQVSQVLPAT